MLSPNAFPFSKMAVKWRDITWPRKSPKFNLHHLQKISTGFKMAVLTLKSGMSFLMLRKNADYRIAYFLVLGKTCDVESTTVQLAMDGPCMADPRFLILLFNVFLTLF